ncbi:MAG: hypothetical protein ACP5I3_09645 [Thermoproteus sp.]
MRSFELLIQGNGEITDVYLPRLGEENAGLRVAAKIAGRAAYLEGESWTGYAAYSSCENWPAGWSSYKTASSIIETDLPFEHYIFRSLSPPFIRGLYACQLPLL